MFPAEHWKLVVRWNNWHFAFALQCIIEGIQLVVTKHVFINASCQVWVKALFVCFFRLKLAALYNLMPI